MKTREEIKDQILDLKARYLLLELPTSLGKTRIALENTYNNKTLLNKQVLVVYPKVALKSTWIAEYKKWGFEEELPNVTFTTYNSIGKYIEQEWDMILFDEGHHISDRVVEIVSHMKFKRATILSATIKPTLRYKLGTVMPGMKVYRVGMRSAISDDILPDPQIVLIPLTLNIVGKTETIIRNPKVTAPVKEIPFENRLLYRDKKTRYVMRCTEAQASMDYDQQVDYYKRWANSSGNKAIKNIWLHVAGERLKWLALKKTSYVNQLLKKLSSERVLTFCATIDQTEQVGSNCIHSKTKAATTTLDAFNEGKIQHITACSMLDEGVNLVNCRVGIFANLNSSERLQIQRCGRILRHKNPVIIIPYFKGTREEEIVSDMLLTIAQDKVVTIPSIDQLNLKKL